MKLSKSAYNDFQRQATPNAILPLIDDDVVTEDHTKTSTFKLRTNPGDGNSPKYTLAVPIIDETATVRQVLKWTMAIGKVTTGLNIADGANKHPIIQELCTGSHLVAYNTGANAATAARWLALQDGSQVRPVLSFEDVDGQWCREYLLSTETQSQRGVACRQDGEWQTLIIADAQIPGDNGDYRPAGSSDNDTVAQFLAERAQGIALSADEEAERLATNWK